MNANAGLVIVCGKLLPKLALTVPAPRVLGDRHPFDLDRGKLALGDLRLDVLDNPPRELLLTDGVVGPVILHLAVAVLEADPERFTARVYPLPIEFTDDWIAHLIANNISVMGTITAVSTTFRDSCQYSPPDFKASLSKKVHKVSLALDMKKIPSCPGGDLSKPSIIELRNDVLVITTGDCNTDFSEQLKTCFRNHI